MQLSLSKGQSLEGIQESVNLFSVPEFHVVSCDAWLGSPDLVLESISSQFGERLVAVRSSAADEDSTTVTQAGAYRSVLNVSASDQVALRSAINGVVASYVERRALHAADEILIQEMVRNVVLSGVVFTHELNSGAPYYVINYDDLSGSTNTVTSGQGDYANRTLYIHRGAVNELRSGRFRALLDAVVELEKVTESDTLDIEFAVGESLHPYLLQFRAITTQPNWNRGLVRRIDAELDGIQSFVRERFLPVEGVFGGTTVFGQMPDWNPAEMIGRAPRALAMSLYQRLITDSAWRMARQRMGYSVPVGQPLMVSLAGQPYVDVRLSFHSYLPSTLPLPISVKLVDTWVNRLRDNPELHDKIEFDVAVTAFTFDLDERMEKLCHTLTAPERESFRESLKNLTQPLLLGLGEGSIDSALERLNRLSKSALPAPTSGPLGLMRAVEECIRNGTVPFAILARHGFIARTLLLSLVNRGILKHADVTRLQGSISTVASEFLGNIELLRSGHLHRTDFMRRFGHLRPGTYDILSPRYDQMPNFGQVSEATYVRNHATDQARLSNFTEQQQTVIDELLQDAGLTGVNSNGLLRYVEAAIAGREYGKFIFTRSVSAMLELIAAFGEANGLSREEMSHVRLDDILELGAESGGGRSIEERLRRISATNAERHGVTTAIRLPQVLFDEASVRVVPFQVSRPNFITSFKVIADTYYLSPYESTVELTQRMVLIDNADPGYDWIFSHNIAGLITKYGGANSHMAIRCAELGVPAAIGCGEQRFSALAFANKIALDCSAGLIEVLH